MISEVDTAGESDVFTKNSQKLCSMSLYFADKVPALSSYYMKQAQDLVTSARISNDDSFDQKLTTCPWCGTVFNGTNLRVRHKAKKAPSSGRWANLMTRELSPYLAPNTRQRVERLRHARIRTTVTCLTCGKWTSNQGAPRMPRDERANHMPPDELPADVTSQKRKKKKKRRKETNAGLTIANHETSFMTNDAKQSKKTDSLADDRVITSSPPITTDNHAHHAKIQAHRVTSTTPDSAHNFRNPAHKSNYPPPTTTAHKKKTIKHSDRSDAQSAKIPNLRPESKNIPNTTKYPSNPTSTKSAKKKKKANQLSALLALDQKRKSGTSLSEFLKQV